VVVSVVSAAARTRYPAYPGKIDPADLISAADLDRAPDGGYSLEVPGVGKVLIANDDPRVTSGCALHRPTLSDQLVANPPSPSQHRWLNLTIYDCMGQTCCLGPLGGSCYKLIRFAAP